MRKRIIIPILIVVLCMSGCSTQIKSAKDSSADKQVVKKQAGEMKALMVGM